jgi:hypothetical protein
MNLKKNFQLTFVAHARSISPDAISSVITARSFDVERSASSAGRASE